MYAAETQAQKEFQPIENSEWYNEYITNEEVTMSLKKMKRQKAVGPDRIAIDVLKDYDMLIPLVTSVFNGIFGSENIPEARRLAQRFSNFTFRGTPRRSAGSFTEPSGLRGNAHGTLKWFFILPTSVSLTQTPSHGRQAAKICTSHQREHSSNS